MHPFKSMQFRKLRSIYVIESSAGVTIAANFNVKIFWIGAWILVGVARSFDCHDR